MNAAIQLAILAAGTGGSVQVIDPVDPVEAPAQVVRYDDLDLSDSTGARVLYERIETAAEQVCGPVRAHDVSHAWVRPCIRRAVAKAVSDVDEPTLTMLHSCGDLSCR